MEEKPMDYNKAALEMHESHKGKVGIVSKVEVATRDDLSTAYTPGVAEPCRKIKANPEDVYKYTFKGNMVAVVSNGTAVLGLGDIGPEAGLPVMEGKAVLFKEFGGVDAFGFEESEDLGGAIHVQPVVLAPRHDLCEGFVVHLLAADEEVADVVEQPHQIAVDFTHNRGF